MVHLPAPLTVLIGRERELAILANILDDPAVRLVTLIGPGGVGKTRLAFRLAADLAASPAYRFADGVVVVELATARDIDQVVPAIAQALRLRHDGSESAVAVLTTHLLHRQMLLILDNFEQVINAGPRIGELLRTCPGLTVLVTSRALLNLSGERAVTVPRLLDSEAERLFVERAAAVHSGFALTAANAGAIAEICRRLDGLPLAIELAAARSALFTPQGLLGRLEKRLPQLTGGPRDAPARHQTMRDAIAWSYDLLSPDEQAVFRRLGVFVGGCTLEAAEIVCSGGAEAESGRPSPSPERRSSPDVGGGVGVGATSFNQPSSPNLPPSIVEAVESLVRQSLLGVVASDDEDSPRLVMLETVREFALEQLVASVEEAAIRIAHARWYLDQAEESDVSYRSGIGHARWLTRLQLDLPNIRAALDWLHKTGDVESSLRLTGALNGFWYFRGHFTEGRTWLTRALEHRSRTVPPAVLARALQIAGELAHYQGDDPKAVPLLLESLPLCHEAGDEWGTAFGRFMLGIVAEDAADFDAAESQFEEAIGFWERGSYVRWEAIAGYHLGIVAQGRGDLARAAEVEEHARAQFESVNDAWGVAMTLGFLGLISVERADHVRAATYYAEALPLWRDLGLPEGLVRGLAGIATLAANTGRLHESARLFGAVRALTELLGLNFDLHQQAMFDRATDSVRARLGDSDFEAVWSIGRTLSREDVIAEALAFVTILATSRPPLTPREMEIMHLLPADMSVTTIAETLFLSVRTVENHIAHIFTKLGVRSRTEAVATARATGLIDAGVETH